LTKYRNAREPIMSALMKTCKRCQRDLPLTAFHRDSSMSDGRERRCKSCRAEIAAERYERNREKILEQCHEYYVENKPEVLARNAQWRAAHPEAIKGYCRKHRAKSKAEGVSS
jgi:hypothetical protein